MDSADVDRIERRTRARYEWSRAKRAVLGFGPALLIVAGAAALARHPMWTSAFGATLFVGGVALLWYGRDLKRAVLPGVAAGLIPLALALCAVRVGHACTGDGCMMLCVPACARLGASLRGSRLRRWAFATAGGVASCHLRWGT